jgi:hypothetical protein
VSKQYRDGKMYPLPLAPQAPHLTCTLPRVHMAEDTWRLKWVSTHFAVADQEQLVTALADANQGLSIFVHPLRHP